VKLLISIAENSSLDFILHLPKPNSRRSSRCMSIGCPGIASGSSIPAIMDRGERWTLLIGQSGRRRGNSDSTCENILNNPRQANSALASGQGRAFQGSRISPTGTDVNDPIGQFGNNSNRPGQLCCRTRRITYFEAKNPGVSKRRARY